MYEFFISLWHLYTYIQSFPGISQLFISWWWPFFCMRNEMDETNFKTNKYQLNISFFFPRSLFLSLTLLFLLLCSRVHFFFQWLPFFCDVVHFAKSFIENEEKLINAQNKQSVPVSSGMFVCMQCLMFETV